MFFFYIQAKSSLSNELERSCAMCINYEKQLQKLHTQKQNLTEETSVLLEKVKQSQVYSFNAKYK